MKKLLLLGACWWALAAAPARAQTAPVDLVVVRIRNSEWAVVTRGEGQSETIHLLKGSSRDTFTDATEEYHKLLSKLYYEGYTLQNSFVNGQFGEVTTLVFAKPKH